MTRIAPIDPNSMGNCTKRPTPNGQGRLGWLSRALVLSVGCLVAYCGGGANTSDPGKTGEPGTGGTTGTGGTASSGTSAGGDESGGTSGGGTANSGGAGGSKTGGAGSSTSTGGTSGSGGKAAGGTTHGTGGVDTGGKSGTGGVANTGGKSGTGGAANTGGKSGTGGAANTGGATGTGGKSGADGGGGGATAGTFTVTSPGWTNTEGCGPTTKTSCSPLPVEITRSGAGTSPELHWTGAPEGTKSFAVLFQDLNNSTAHWILWNIPPTITTLAANVDRTTATPATPAGSQQCGKGTDAATSDGYYGPGAPCNVYELIVYALSVSSFSPTNATDEKLVRSQLQALGSSILGTATLRGRTNQACN